MLENLVFFPRLCTTIYSIVLRSSLPDQTPEQVQARLAFITIGASTAFSLVFRYCRSVRAKYCFEFILLAQADMLMDMKLQCPLSFTNLTAIDPLNRLSTAVVSAHGQLPQPDAVLGGRSRARVLEHGNTTSSASVPPRASPIRNRPDTRDEAHRSKEFD